MLVIEQCILPIDFHSREINTMEVNGEDCLALQNIFFCVQHKKETYTGLERHEGE